MKVTILNGNDHASNVDFDQYINQLEDELNSHGHQVKHLLLRDMKINYCIGCFDCWLKTPGECVHHDDGRLVPPAILECDFLLWASPLRLGYPSAILKRTMDRSIPILLPHFDIVNDEAHHAARYPHYPLAGLLIAPEADTDTEDRKLVENMFSRTALNMKSRLTFSADTAQSPAEVATLIENAAGLKKTLPAYPAATRGVAIQPPHRITVFNGSPRGKKGNSPILLGKFLQGFTAANPANSSEIFDLAETRRTEEFAAKFAGAECAVIAFPLYTDAMPGIVKTFIEALEPCKERSQNPPVLFVVQSGFPEAAHSRFVEAYLQKLAARLGCPYVGTIVKGGLEGIQGQPEQMTRKLFERFEQIGRTFGETGALNGDQLARLAKPERFPRILGPLFKLLSASGLLNMWWDMQLKQNQAFEQRFNRPYAQ
jgi:multimeric flavodoxin WrbA